MIKPLGRNSANLSSILRSEPDPLCDPGLHVGHQGWLQNPSAFNCQDSAAEKLPMGLAGLFALAAVDFGSDPFFCLFPKCAYGEPGSG